MMGLAKFNKVEKFLEANSKKYFLSILKKRNMFVNVLSRLSMVVKAQ
jgi:hypothetical protein